MQLEEQSTQTGKKEETQTIKKETQTEIETESEMAEVERVTEEDTEVEAGATAETDRDRIGEEKVTEGTETERDPEGVGAEIAAVDEARVAAEVEVKIHCCVCVINKEFCRMCVPLHLLLQNFLHLFPCFCCGTFTVPLLPAQLT